MLLTLIQRPGEVSDGLVRLPSQSHQRLARHLLHAEELTTTLQMRKRLNGYYPEGITLSAATLELAGRVLGPDRFQSRRDHSH